MGVGSSYHLWSPQYLGVLNLTGLRSLHLVFQERLHMEGAETRLLRWRLDSYEIGSLSKLDLKTMEISFMFTGEEHEKMQSPGVEEVGRVVESYRKEILGSHGVYLARRKAEQEGDDRDYDAHRATARWQILRNRQ
jgi:hypothetical protein